MKTSNKIIIVGSPNVGKSVIFNYLTGRYATVSNYPGTTIEVYKGITKIGKEKYEVIDTPGMYSLMPVTEEERVARNILLNEKSHVVVHIIDAKNIERMLPFTLQLIEAGLPLILVLNIMDEADRLDMKININHIKEELGVPIVSAVGITGKGISALRGEIENFVSKESKKFEYSTKIENFIKSISSKMKAEYSVSKRLLCTLLLQNDNAICDIIKDKEGNVFKDIEKKIKALKKSYPNPLSYVIAMERQEVASRITSMCTILPKKFAEDFKEKISKMTMNPVFGFVMLLLVLYFGLYKFVGEFGAGTLVNFIENVVFDKYIIPPITKFIEWTFPWIFMQDLFIHEYGLITLGFRYAIAIILPIVGTFFLVFAIIEDTGYLPRLAMLIDKIFKVIGLSGRAVIPMVLGLGCGTMATMVTRTLATKRERIIATILLSLSIPCSAQLGVILSLLGGKPKAMAIWIAVISFICLLVGFLSSKIIIGEKPIFFMEVPPLRMPKISNLMIKTYTRMEWYFKEIFPLFIVASLLIWVGRIIGLFDLLINILSYPVTLIGLPKEASKAYLFGFFRRDYGTAGIYDLNKNGLLSGNQLLISVIVMTLFLPCIAQFLITIKERGWKVGLFISAFVFMFAFIVGYILNLILNIFKVVI